MREAPARETKAATTSRAGAVIPLPVPEGDEALLAALRANHPLARAALFDRHAERVRRVLLRVLGLDQDVPDLIQDVFLTALTALPRLEDPSAVGAFLTGIAVRHARSLIRKRSRRRILRFVAPEELPERAAPAASPEHREVMRAFYRLLDELPADERIAFALRFVEGMDLHEVAAACGVSRATACRRLARAEQRVSDGARQKPAIAEYLRGGSRWSR